MGGEESDLDLFALLPLVNGHKDPSEPSSSSPAPSSPSKSTSSGKKSTSAIQRAPARPTPFPGCLPGSSGGYYGTEGQGDWALEREMEILRLEDENRALREMLAIAQESALGGEGREEEKVPDLAAMRDRKASLTVEELEADAEKEEAEKEARAGEVAEEPGTGAGTGLGGGSGVVDRGRGYRPVLSESALGFSAEMPSPEEAIDDGPDG